MFDIGFWELIVISIIGLIVLGPERLPVAIRKLVRWISKVKGMANTVKTELSQELKLHEMNENMIKASKQELNDLDPELQQSIDEMKKTAQEITRPYQNKHRDLPATENGENSILDKSTRPSSKQDESE